MNQKNKILINIQNYGLDAICQEKLDSFYIDYTSGESSADASSSPIACKMERNSCLAAI